MINEIAAQLNGIISALVVFAVATLAMNIILLQKQYIQSDARRYVRGIRPKIIKKAAREERRRKKRNENKMRRMLRAIQKNYAYNLAHGDEEEEEEEESKPRKSNRSENIVYDYIIAVLFVSLALMCILYTRTRNEIGDLNYIISQYEKRYEDDPALDYNGDYYNNYFTASETVYWVSGGKVWHISRDCPSLENSHNIRSGSISDSDKARVCKICGGGEYS